MDTGVEPSIQVHKANGGVMVFHEHPSGLYVHDLGSPSDMGSTSTPAYSYLQTVAQNKARYTRRQVEYADGVRALYHRLGRPSIPKFLKILSNNLLLNCPYSTDDLKRAEDIYGTDVAFLKGKTTDSPDTDRERDRPYVSLPEHIRSRHSEVTLCCDIFYLQGLPFSVSISKQIRYASVRFLPDTTAASLATALRADLKMYSDRGFSPTTIHGDGEYHPMRNKLPDTSVVICAADSHVPEAERCIRTLKETVRATIHGMPYRRLPKTLMKGLATYAMICHNMFPHDDGIDGEMSPETIVRGDPTSRL